MITATETPEQTLAQAVQGDTEAFAVLVRDHQSMVFSVAWHFLQDRSLAEDLAQEVFLHLHRHLQSIQSPAHLVSWLRRVTAHRCIDHLRQTKNHARVGLEDAPEPATSARTSDPFLLEKMRQLVGLLPEQQRMVVILRYQEEMEPQEIAATLDVPVGTVKSTLHRGLASLRAKLARWERTKSHGTL